MCKTAKRIGGAKAPNPVSRGPVLAGSVGCGIRDGTAEK